MYSADIVLLIVHILHVVLNTKAFTPSLAQSKEEQQLAAAVQAACELLLPQKTMQHHL
jgi:hypothetical protein